MAEIKGQLTLNEIALIATDDDPSTGGGLTAPIGSLALLDVEDDAGAWLKYGVGDTSWARLARQANGTVFSAGSVIFSNADGLLSQNNSQFFWDNPNASLGLGLSSPQAKLHLDGGNATAVSTKYTAGTTTGQGPTDGFDVGIDGSGNAELRQRENLALNFYTNNTLRAYIDNAGVLGVTNGTALTTVTTGWFTGGTASWINLDTTGPSGIGTGGPGVNPFLAYVADTGHWFTNSVVGDVAYRNNAGRILIGTNGAVPADITVNTSGLITFRRGILVGDETNTSNGVIRYSATNELLGRVNGQWRNLATMPIVITATANTSTSAAGYSTIAGMTSTPGAGTYLVVFSCNAYLNGTDGSGDITLFVNGVEDNTCFRTIGSNNTGLGGINQMRCTLAFMTTATVADGQVIDVRMRENGNDTLNISQRVFMLIPISRGA